MFVPAGEDRRLFDRFEARFPVKFQEANDDFGEDVFLRDASADGLRLATSRRLPLNERVDLLVSLPDGQAPLDLHGRIIWANETDSRKWEIGLRLDETRLMRMHRLYKFTAEAEEV